MGQFRWAEGTVYLKNGIIKEGLVKLDRVSKDIIAFNGKQRVKFKSQKKAKKEKYDHTQVEKVIFHNLDEESVEFVYVQISDKKHELFTKKVEGKADLYVRTVRYTTCWEANDVEDIPMYLEGGENMEYYVLREGEKIASPLITVRFFSKSFTKRAVAYFSDCPALVEKLESKSIRGKQIEEVVTIYNNCQ